MCKFLSAIGMKDGDILCNPSIDSHEDLIKVYDLKDSKLRNWVRLEFYPDNNDYGDIKKYKLHIDDDILTWISDELKSKWERKLTARMKKIIITAEKYMLAGGVYILKDANILKMTNCKVIYMSNSTVEKMWGNSTVERMLDNSTVKEMWGNSTVKEMWDNSTVERMWDNSTVEIMLDNSTVEKRSDYNKENGKCPK